MPSSAFCGRLTQAGLSRIPLCTVKDGLEFHRAPKLLFLQQLYRRANQAMYDAKFTGGGKLVARDFLPAQQPIAVAPVAAAWHG